VRKSDTSGQPEGQGKACSTLTLVQLPHFITRSVKARFLHSLSAKSRSLHAPREEMRPRIGPLHSKRNTTEITLFRRSEIRLWHTKPMSLDCPSRGAIVAQEIGHEKHEKTRKVSGADRFSFGVFSCLFVAIYFGYPHLGGSFAPISHPKNIQNLSAKTRAGLNLEIGQGERHDQHPSTERIQCRGQQTARIFVRRLVRVRGKLTCGTSDPVPPTSVFEFSVSRRPVCTVVVRWLVVLRW